jgi:hypothetical protein
MKDAIPMKGYAYGANLVQRTLLWINTCILPVLEQISITIFCLKEVADDKKHLR